jgi:hypothetical protein
LQTVPDDHGSVIAIWSQQQATRVIVLTSTACFPMSSSVPLKAINLSTLGHLRFPQANEYATPQKPPLPSGNFSSCLSPGKRIHYWDGYSVSTTAAPLFRTSPILAARLSSPYAQGLCSSRGTRSQGWTPDTSLLALGASTPPNEHRDLLLSAKYREIFS